MRLVIASNNAHKLTELQALLGPLNLQCVSQGSLGVTEAPEPFETFIENALCKARHAASCTGSPALADDSGLCVEALGGAPGVKSARYASLWGRPSGDAQNNLMLLEQLQDQTNRRARFVCALVVVRSAHDPEPLVAMGRWAGEVLKSPQGNGGFGYDPLVFVPTLGRSVGQLSPELKNEYSHRALAMREMVQLMREVGFA